MRRLLKIPGQIFLGTNRIDTAIRTDGKQKAAAWLPEFYRNLNQRYQKSLKEEN